MLKKIHLFTAIALLATLNSFAVAPAGTLNTSFNVGEGAANEVYSMAIQNDGKIIIAGAFMFYDNTYRKGLARLNTNGSLDSSFNASMSTYIQVVALQPDGKILISGVFTSIQGIPIKGFARLNSNGSLDTTFKTGSGPDAYVASMTLQNDGKIIITGEFTSYNGIPAKSIARINANGTIDPSFNIGAGANSALYGAKLQSDGKIIVFGAFTNINGTNIGRIARLNPDGSLDTSFNSGGTGCDDAYPVSISIQKNDKIIIGGKFTSYNGVVRNRIARLNADGSLDLSFNPGLGTSNWVYATEIQPDGKILIGGPFSAFNNVSAGHIARLNTDGSIDVNFQNATGSGLDEVVDDIILQSNGNILAGGWFHNFNGVASNCIVNIIGDSPDSRCNNLKLNFKNVVDLTCSTPSGSAALKAYSGTPPYTFKWITGTSVNDSMATFNSAGNYLATVSDELGCTDTASLVVGGPKYPSNTDLSTHLISSGFRTGFDSKVWLNASSSGCLKASGKITLILDSLVTYKSALIPPHLIKGDSLIWFFANMQYLPVASFSPYVEVNTSLSAKIGDTIRLKTIIDIVTNEMDITNNVKEYRFPVINAFDPNDKQVYPVGECTEGFIKNDQLLTYTVRFQNTGNADAINISVLDSLSEHLDISTLSVVASSDTMHLEISANNIVRFVFNDIHLADSTTNEAASHGYVVFEIKPKAGLSNLTQIKNKVGIYFDFNPAVVTNTVLNTVAIGAHPACILTSVEGIKNNSLSLYPNPGQDIFTLVSNENAQNIIVYDNTGRMVYNTVPTNNSTIINLSKCTPGLYFIQVQYNNRIETIKAVLKE